MRLVIPILCLPIIGACGTSTMGSDAAMMDSARPGVDAAGLDGAFDSAMGIDAALGVDSAIGCAYPLGPVEPMALDEVIWPYRWPEAIVLADARNIPLDLEEAHCTSDENIDWSPFDVLVFISIPAW